VEDVDIDGSVLGGAVHVQSVRTISISATGVLSASALGECFLSTALGVVLPLLCMYVFFFILQVSEAVGYCNQKILIACSYHWLAFVST
jgi:hypothetical protein